jgi:acyl dehydratase
VDKIQFDDIEKLQSRVSEEFGPFGGEIEVSQKMINDFAELTGDRQWIHIDVERCKKESPFGGPIAHGFLTLSLLPAVSASSERQEEYAIVGAGNVVNYGADKLRFLSPVPAGAKITSRSRLAAVEAGKKGPRVEREIAIHIVGNDRPALLYRMILLFQPKRS